MIRPHRNHPLWYAFLLHRISGIGLALFLPFHFLVLSLALSDPAALNEMLGWTRNPWVHFAEVMLILLLALHLIGGIRLMAMEWLPWSPRQKTLAAASFGGSVGVALLFLILTV